MLGFYAMRANRFGQAVEYFRAVKNLDPRQAFDYHRAFAYASYRLGDRRFQAAPRDEESTQ